MSGNGRADERIPNGGADAAVLRAVRETVARHAMLPPGAPVVLMVSGGADSVAMLRLFEQGVVEAGRLLVLHVDHALRPESAADAEWVRSLCGSLGVECEVVRRDVAAEAEDGGLNLEDAGRRARYELAEAVADRLARDAGVSPEGVRIATAHTLDDRVETMLMRLVEGAGPAGLSGPRPVRGRIVRPLIETRRAALRDWLCEIGQDWLEDPSNLDTSRRRAWVRHELLPLLEGVNPAFVEAAGRTAELLAEEDTLLGEMAEAFARDFAVPLPEGPDGAFSEAVALDAAMLTTLSAPMARRVLRIFLRERFPESSRLDLSHVDRVLELLRAEDGSNLDGGLPGGVSARLESGRLVFAGAQDDVPAAGSTADGGPAAGTLPVPGELDLGDAGVLRAEVLDEWEVTADPDTAWLDAGEVSRRLQVGPVRDGERIRPLGMSGSKPVADLLAEAGIPARLKPRVPVVRDGDTVVWVAGVRLSEDHKVRPETDRVVRLTWEKRADG
ncbi:MAG: tRNA lysidine(34) synthetase TilS [Coriobacteriia bacterium]